MVLFRRVRCSALLAVFPHGEPLCVIVVANCSFGTLSVGFGQGERGVYACMVFIAARGARAFEGIRWRCRSNLRVRCVLL